MFLFQWHWKLCAREALFHSFPRDCGHAEFSCYLAQHHTVSWWEQGRNLSLLLPLLQLRLALPIVLLLMLLLPRLLLETSTLTTASENFTTKTTSDTTPTITVLLLLLSVSLLFINLNTFLSRKIGKLSSWTSAPLLRHVCLCSAFFLLLPFRYFFYQVYLSFKIANVCVCTWVFAAKPIHRKVKL